MSLSKSVGMHLPSLISSSYSFCLSNKQPIWVQRLFHSPAIKYYAPTNRGQLFANLYFLFVHIWPKQSQQLCFSVKTHWLLKGLALSLKFRTRWLLLAEGKGGISVHFTVFCAALVQLKINWMHDDSQFPLLTLEWPSSTCGLYSFFCSKTNQA